jgi:hypothetical protein
MYVLMLISAINLSFQKKKKNPLVEIVFPIEIWPFRIYSDNPYVINEIAANHAYSLFNYLVLHTASIPVRTAGVWG